MVDNLIILFESTETSFTTNGIGNLTDAISCIVTEERNGAFELEMEYPIDGIRYSELSLRRIIFAKPNPYDDPQPFRIYSITKPIDGVVTVNAEHISYDLSGYPVSPFTASNIGEAFNNFKSKSVVNCPFTFSTDKTTEAIMTVDRPESIRSLLGGSEGSILDIYGGGEYAFDKFNVTLNQHRGSNNGVSIRYGKNLTNLKQEENCSSVYTGVYPYWYSMETGVAELSEKVVNAEGTYNFVRILPLDLTRQFDDMPSEEQLRTAAKTYMTSNNIGVPKVSLDVSFVQLAQSEEYADIAILEKVKLCDTVNVEFPELNVSATAKCISTEYDVIMNKYNKLELGDSKSNLASTISDQSQTISAQEKSFSSVMDKAISDATNLITGGLGGHVLIRSSSGGKKPDEILIMDTDDINTATKVWRWNLNGWGYSKNGYNGPYEMAATMDGVILANMIKAGLLSLGGVNGAYINVFDSSGSKIGYWGRNGIEFYGNKMTASMSNGNFSIKGTNDLDKLDNSYMEGHIIGVNSFDRSLWSYMSKNGFETNGKVTADILDAGNSGSLSKTDNAIHAVSGRIRTENGDICTYSGDIYTDNGYLYSKGYKAVVQNSSLIDGNLRLIPQENYLLLFDDDGLIGRINYD